MIEARPRLLQLADSVPVSALVASDPVLNCVLAARLRLVPDLNPQRLGGFLWGIPDGSGTDELRAAIFHGGNLIPIGDDLAALEAIALQVSRGGRGCSSIVGPASSVEVIWPVLSRYWGRARSVRACQPLLVTDLPSDEPADPEVRQVRPSELGRFLPAAVAMFTEELGTSPVATADGGRGYRNRLAELIGAGRAFARFDRRGQVMFKAEIAALSPATAQVQGVWVRPDLRGRGVGTAAMAAVLRQVLAVAPTVSLYANDYNTAALRMYRRLGLRQINTLQTVLF